MNQKGFSPLFIILGIILVVGIAGGAYYFGKSQSVKPVVLPSPPTVTSQTPQPAAISQTTLIPSSSSTDQTANWKTYTKLGYEIKYPQSSVVTEYSPDPSMPDLLSSTSTEIEVDNQSTILFLVEVWKNLGVNITDTSSRDKWCSLLQKELTGQLECNYGGNLPLMQVNGYQSYQIAGGRDNSKVKVIYIPHNNYVYEISVPTEGVDGKQFPVSNQILSTFKFTQ